MTVIVFFSGNLEVEIVYIVTKKREQNVIVCWWYEVITIILEKDIHAHLISIAFVILIKQTAKHNESSKQEED